MSNPISGVTSDLFMENLEEEAMDTALPGMRLKLWQLYIDDSLKVVWGDKWDGLIEHLNTSNKTGRGKFTDEPEKDGSIPPCHQP